MFYAQTKREHVKISSSLIDCYVTALDLHQFHFHSIIFTKLTYSFVLCSMNTNLSTKVHIVSDFINSIIQRSVFQVINIMVE